MILEISNNSNKGYVRHRNEDMILCGKELIRDFSYQIDIELTPDSRFIIAIADGMGGHLGGDLASKIVCEDFSHFFQQLPNHLSVQQLNDELNRWIQNIHERILLIGNKTLELQGMGTTLVALLFYEGQILWINCGDSRIYRLRNQILAQLSDDHSLISLTNNRNVPTNIITNSVGAGQSVYLDIHHITGSIYNNDAFLLCSDGLTDTLGDNVIEETLLNSSLNQLISDAVNAGAADNVSASLIKIHI